MALQERRLPPQVFRLLRKILYDYCGIYFDYYNDYIVQRRVQPPLDALSLGDFAEYYRYLRSCDPGARRQQLEEVVARVTASEAYLFRESHQLDAYRQEILPEIFQARPRARRLSVWSAGCASGEQAYTIAI